MLKRLALILLLATIAAPAVAQEKLKVVATFSILADLVRNVGGDRVVVEGVSLVEQALRRRDRDGPSTGPGRLRAGADQQSGGP